MMFDKNDEAFVVRAADAKGRADVIGNLSFLRALSFIVAIVGGVCALLEFFLEKRAGSAGVCAASAIVFFAITLHTDAQIKALKLFGRLASDKSPGANAGGPCQ